MPWARDTFLSHHFLRKSSCSVGVLCRCLHRHRPLFGVLRVAATASLPVFGALDLAAVAKSFASASMLDSEICQAMARKAEELCTLDDDQMVRNQNVLKMFCRRRV